MNLTNSIIYIYIYMITLYYYVVSKLVKKQFALIYLTGQISITPISHELSGTAKIYSAP